jgi:hypothetical protein
VMRWSGEVPIVAGLTEEFALAPAHAKDGHFRLTPCIINGRE